MSRKHVVSDPQARLAGHEDAVAVAIAHAREMAGGCAWHRGVTTEADAAEAFRFANHAMWLQRVHARRQPSAR